MTNGSHVRVTDLNKSEFILKKCHYVAYKATQEQLQSLQEGFHKVIPVSWIALLNPDELEAAICGNPYINISDWKKHTDLKGYHSYSLTVGRFWNVMETYS